MPFTADPVPPLRPSDVRKAVRGAAHQPRTTRLVTLFVASPGDVAEERGRVRAVVERVHRAVGPEVRIDVVRWEDYAAPDWSRPQAVVFGNTSFASIDLFVGIFWSRLGTPSGAVDPTRGVEYESGTVEELAAARRLYEEGSLRRIMLYFRHPQRPPQNEEEARQAAGVAELCGRLETGPERGLIRRYATPEEFGERLYDDLCLVAKGFLPEARATRAVHDAFIVKLCDRLKQDRDFSNFYQAGITGHPGRPQAAILWGARSEGHESFRERIQRTHLFLGAASARAGEDPRIVDWQPEWPRGAPPEDLRRQLAQGLAQEIRLPFPGDTDYSARAVTALPEIREADIVLLHHDVYVKRWPGDALELLRWYLEEYWGALEDDPARPPIVVLIKVICYPTLPPEEREAVRADLEALCAPGSAGCRRILLPELQPITDVEVEAWMKRYAGQVTERQLMEMVEEVFTREDGGAADALSMADLEERLLALLEKARAPRGKDTNQDPE